MQRWRTRNNPISNTIGGSEGTEFLISAPYADKLPIKVAEYIRQNVPFAILIPISLLNGIDRIGKNEIDEAVRDKRSRMKLVISTASASLVDKSSQLPTSCVETLCILYGDSSHGAITTRFQLDFQLMVHEQYCIHTQCNAPVYHRTDPRLRRTSRERNRSAHDWGQAPQARRFRTAHS